METIGEAYQRASSFLQNNNCTNHTFEAEWLLREVLGWKREYLFTHWEETISDNDQTQLQTWLSRRVQGEPIQYIVGKQNFYGRDFRVNPDVLIPRPETEELVERVLHEAGKQWPEQSLSVVDIGTGSGAIAITLALESPKWQVMAIDLSTDALSVAKQNAQVLQAEANIRFFHGDLLKPILDTGCDFAVLVSNPPYISQEDYENLESQVRDFEPQSALVGGGDGLDYYRQIKNQLLQLPQNRLRLIAFEIGFDQGSSVAELFASLAKQNQVHVEQDVAGLDRIVWFWMRND